MFLVGHVDPFIVILQGKSIASCYFGDALIATLFLLFTKSFKFQELALWLDPFFLDGAHAMFLLLVVGD
jgi:hypothetical protein